MHHLNSTVYIVSLLELIDVSAIKLGAKTNQFTAYFSASANSIVTAMASIMPWRIVR